MQKNNSFEKGALFLVVSGLIAKALGALYRIPLTNIIGVEGIGMYQMIIPTLLLMLALSSNYLPITISKCTAYLTQNKESLEGNRIFKSATGIVLITTFIIATVLITFSKNIAVLQHNENLYICYILIIPTIILSGIKNVYRGWFLGYRNMTYPSIAQLGEQIVKILTSLTLAYLGIKRSILHAVYGATIGLVCGEIFGLVFLLIVRKNRLTERHTGEYNKLNYYKLIINESFPVMISRIVFPIVSFIDSFLIVNLLNNYGLSSTNAIRQYRLLQGPVHSLVHLPIMVGTSLALAIIPMLSSLFSSYKTKDIKEKSSMSIKLCLSLVIPAAVGMMILSQPLLEVLYPKLDQESIVFCNKLLIFSSINIVLLALLEVFTSILQGLSQSNFAAKTIVLTTLVKVILEIMIVRKIGIYGAIISNICMYLIALITLSVKYETYVGKDKSLLKNIGKIVIASGIMALVINLTTRNIENNLLYIVVTMCVGLVAYLISNIVLEVFTEKELSSIPFGKIIIKIIRGKNHDKSNRAWK